MDLNQSSALAARSAKGSSLRRLDVAPPEVVSDAAEPCPRFSNALEFCAREFSLRSKSLLMNQLVLGAASSTREHDVSVMFTTVDWEVA